MNNTAAKTITLQGVFIEVFDTGVLICGPHGVGKSELGLSLVQQDHRLIADDCVLIRATEEGHLYGSCPFLLQDFLEVHDLGIINVRMTFGNTAICAENSLDLIVTLTEAYNYPDAPDVALVGSQRMKKILDTNIPEWIIHNSPRRNLSLIVTTIVKLYLQRKRGYSASDEIAQRQYNLLQSTL